jgi:hypothetical protein|nr:MAG TPA: hypothetical protein [Caudoviricetes sp.]
MNDNMSIYEREAILREVISENLRWELRGKSFIIGLIILIIYSALSEKLNFLSLVSLVYIGLCMLDVTGIYTRRRLMKLYDEDFKINIQLRNAQKFGYYFTSSMGLNTFMYIVLNTAILMLLVKYMI